MILFLFFWGGNLCNYRYPGVSGAIAGDVMLSPAALSCPFSSSVRCFSPIPLLRLLVYFSPLAGPGLAFLLGLSIWGKVLQNA